MSILHYLKTIRRPQTQENHFQQQCLEAIAEANQEIQVELNSTKKHGEYKKYTPAQCSAIGKYSFLHGAAAVAKPFSKLCGSEINDSTVKSIKKAYLEELRKRPRSENSEDITAIPTKKRGRKLLLGEDLDMKVQVHLRKVRKGGFTVSARIVLSAAQGILLKRNFSPLVQNGKPVDLNKFWAHSLMKE